MGSFQQFAALEQRWTMEHMSRSVEGALQKMNSEQLEGALFLLFTLHDSLSGVWTRQGRTLNSVAIAQIFDKLTEICSSLRVTTRRYKSAEWMSGALEIIEELRHHLRMIEESQYERAVLVERLRDLIDTADNCVECLGG